MLSDFGADWRGPVMSRARQLEGVDAHVHQASRRNDQVVDRATIRLNGPLHCNAIALKHHKTTNVRAYACLCTIAYHKIILNPPLTGENGILASSKANRKCSELKPRCELHEVSGCSPSSVPVRKGK